MPFRDKFKTNEEYNAWFREYRKKNAEKYRAWHNAYARKWRKENGLAAEQRYKDKYPHKERSRKILRAAVYLGKIKRGNCEVCAKPNGQGHHEDYTKPLQVNWLCPLHHTEKHKKISPPCF